MGRATLNFFLAPPPGALERGQKVKYLLISITRSISKIFIPNCVCVLTNERYKTYQTGFLFRSLGHALEVGLWALVVPRGVNFFSNMVMWYIKSTGISSITECKQHLYPRVKLVTLGWGQRSTRGRSRWGAFANPHAKVFDCPSTPKSHPQAWPWKQNKNSVQYVFYLLLGVKIPKVWYKNLWNWHVNDIWSSDLARRSPVWP